MFTAPRIVPPDSDEGPSEAAASAEGASADWPASTGQLLRLQQTALENTANAVVITDPQGKIQWVNRAFTALTGYPAVEAVGQTPRLLKSGQHDRAFYQELWRTILGGQTWRGEFTNRRKDGSLYCGEQVITPVRADGGAITHFVGVMNDITARRKAEAAERATHVQLQHLLSHSPAVIYGLRLADGRIVPHLVSDNVRQLLDFTVAETMSYEWWFNRLHPDDRQRVVAGLAETLAHETTRTEYRLRHRDGTYRWVDDNRRRLRDASGQPAEFIGVWSDITERKRAEEVLRCTAVKRSGEQRKTIIAEMAIMAVGAVLVFTAGHALGWFQWIFSKVSHEAQHVLLEDALAVAAILLPCLGVFAFRRWRESRAEACSQQTISAALRTLHAELEARVQQRTAELRAANDALRTEVAERKRLESEVALREERLNAFFSGASAGLVHLDRDLRYLQVNETIANMNGLPAAEHLGRTVEEVVPKLAPVMGPLLRRVLATNESILNVELTGETPRHPGVRRSWTVSHFPIRNKDGQPVGVGAIVVEITERKRAEDALRQSEERFRLITETIDDVFWMADLEIAHTAYVSPAYERVWGRTRQSLYDAPRSFLDAVHPRDLPRVLDDLERGKAGKPYAHEYRIIQPTGEVRWIWDRGFPVRDAAGVVRHYVGVAKDITERKRIEDELRESERRFSDMLGNVDLIAMTLDREGCVTFCNDYLLRLTGWTREEVLGVNWTTHFLPKSAAPVREMFFAAIHKGEIPRHYENPIRTRTGELRDIVWNNTLLRDAAGSYIGTASIGEDVTERKRAAAMLEHAKEQYQSIFQNAMEGVFQTTREGALRAANPALARMLGFASPEELIAQRRDAGQQTYVEPQRREEFKRLIEERGFVTGFEYEVYRKDGDRRWVSENARLVRDESGAIVCYEGSMVDITEQRRAASRLALQHAVTEVLAESEGFARTHHRVLETVGRSLQWDIGEWWTVDHATDVLRCTEAWYPSSKQLPGLEAATRQATFARGAGLPGRVWALGRSEWVPDVATDPDCRRSSVAAELGLRSWIGFPIKLRSEVLGVVGFFRAEQHEPDAEMVSTLNALGTQLGQHIERRQLAEQFRQAQKMEAIGTLAGGIAHDFNNIIAAISGYTELAKMELGDRPEANRHLGEVLAASARAASLVRQILAFSRQQEHERKPIQIRHVVREALNLLRATIPAMIEFEFAFERDLPPVLGDPTQVHQVVMNLGTNASHAMQGRPGHLRINLELCHLHEENAERYPGLHRGKYVRLSVSDTGCGMDRATAGRIFEPFFTTKAPGEGTGLGLAVVHGIMQTHEGAVTVQSQPGEGTVFRLYFPAVESPVADVPAEAPTVSSGRGQRILLVDDEQTLAHMNQKVLELLGYRVDAYTDPREALEAIRAQPDGYDLLITDLAMPGMSGTDLAQEIRIVRASLPMVLITGHAANLTPTNARAIGFSELLSKPISVHAIGTVVARVLAGAKQTEPCQES